MAEATNTTTTIVGVPPPPGAPAGGQWGKNKYVGSNTQAAACVGCLCFCIPGLLILACPFDERDCYKVDGKLYTADGQFIGPATSGQFIASAPQTVQQVVQRE